MDVLLNAVSYCLQHIAENKFSSKQTQRTPFEILFFKIHFRLLYFFLKRAQNEVPLNNEPIETPFDVAE